MKKNFLVPIFISISLVFSLSGCTKQNKNISNCSENEKKYINSNFKYVKTLPGVTKDMELSAYNCTILTEGVTVFKQNNKYGVIDKEGDIVIKPQSNEIDCFKNGYATIINKGKKGVIDKRGNMVIKPQFDSISDIQYNHFVIRSNNKDGIIDIKGNILLQPQLYNISFLKVDMG
ncbi:hypothetical protein DFH04_11120 (plasmid) [Clostridium novyi]|uniref:WG repeat-containing protein n=1 Tax=Clostridium novyi TaxID=1542 RepID=UPI000EA1466C|nr:WG repeat-containing protein [Clostridium novyi]AYF55284.1 hypothetical protein DFH04_11120 [Clostridium novyi]